MSESIGVAMAVVSSSVGGSAAAVTRYLAAGADPIALAIVRFGLGFLIVLPVAAAARIRWPRLQDWPSVAGLGVMFFAIAIVLYNVALSYTTAARGTLALSTLPLLTMVAWRGELIMLGTSLCMAFYNVWSRPFIDRSSALGFLTVGMGAGAIALIVVGCFSGAFVTLSEFSTQEWLAGLYLGVGGGALAFVLWIFALQRTTPTRVAVTMTVNPVSAAVVAMVLLNEPITYSFMLGLITVLAGIWIAASDSREGRQ